MSQNPHKLHSTHKFFILKHVHDEFFKDKRAVI